MSKTTNKFSPEVRQRATRMVLDYEAKLPFRSRPQRKLFPLFSLFGLFAHEPIRQCDIHCSGP